MENKNQYIDSMLTAISKILKEQRACLNLSVAQLSEKSGVSVGVISDLENKRGRVPSLTNFVLLAQALKLPDEFFADLIKNKTETISKIDVKENLRNALNAYGLNKTNSDLIMIQIEALRNNQISSGHKRKKLLK